MAKIDVTMVEQTQRRSEWPLLPILACLGVPRSVYFSWQARAEEGQLADMPRGPTRYDRLPTIVPRSLKRCSRRTSLAAWM